MAKLSSPTRLAPSESAATEFTVTSTGSPGVEGRVERARALGLDADHLDPAGEPGGDAGDEAAAADRDEHRVERRQAEAGEVLLPFERDRAGARDRLGRVVGVDRRARRFRRHRRRKRSCASA